MRRLWRLASRARQHGHGTFFSARPQKRLDRCRMAFRMKTTVGVLLSPPTVSAYSAAIGGSARMGLAFGGASTV